MKIKYLPHKQIDKTQWDLCLSNAKNELIYGYSWYLDIVCNNWDALVLGNYDAVMPLPWKRKYGLMYIYHPFFSQQLGIFFKPGITFNASDFISAIPKKFIKYAFSLNHYNADEELDLKTRINYILNLNKSYDAIFAGYTTKCRRDVRLSRKEDIELTENISVDDLLAFKKANLNNKLLNEHFTIIGKLLKYLKTTGNANIYGAFSNNELISAAAFIHHKGRIIYLFSVSSAQGKKQRAMYYIIDEEIRKNCGREIYIDFEGSMIENIARFFKGFGATIETYYKFSKSNIPFIK